LSRPPKRKGGKGKKPKRKTFEERNKWARGGGGGNGQGQGGEPPKPKKKGEMKKEKMVSNPLPSTSQDPEVTQWGNTKIVSVHPESFRLL